MYKKYSYLYLNISTLQTPYKVAKIRNYLHIKVACPAIPLGFVCQIINLFLKKIYLLSMVKSVKKKKKVHALQDVWKDDQYHKENISNQGP